MKDKENYTTTLAIVSPEGMLAACVLDSEGVIVNAIELGICTKDLAEELKNVILHLESKFQKPTVH